MADQTLDTQGAAVEVAKRIGGPVYVLGLAFLLLLGFVLYAGYQAASGFGKPLIDAQIQAVQASMEAIKSNAETNKQTARAVLEIRDLQERQIASMEKVLRNQNGIIESCEQSLKDHQRIMTNLQQCIPARPITPVPAPAGGGGGS